MESDRLSTSTISNPGSLTQGAWDRDEVALGSFTSLSPDQLFSGEWVWIPQENILEVVNRRRLGGTILNLEVDHRVLGLIEYLQGDDAFFVRAYDGVQFMAPQSQLVPVIGSLQGLLDTKRESRRFKEEVLRGIDVQKHPLGKTMASLALGIGQDQSRRSKNMNPHMTKAIETDPSANPKSSDLQPSTSAGRAEVLKPIRNALEDADLYSRGQEFEIGQKVPDEPVYNSNGSFSTLFLAAGVVFLIVSFT